MASRFSAVFLADGFNLGFEVRKLRLDVLHIHNFPPLVMPLKIALSLTQVDLRSKQVDLVSSMNLIVRMILTWTFLQYEGSPCYLIDLKSAD
jgi:hypothetical protein